MEFLKKKIQRDIRANIRNVDREIKRRLNLCTKSASGTEFWSHKARIISLKIKKEKLLDDLSDAVLIEEKKEKVIDDIKEILQ